ncbi:MAG TPA: redoxin domain-containing protein, partial [Bacteroidetes bacterium]|nr:redoxin domain-containing protein [Bacteroidota bacterium]
DKNIGFYGIALSTKEDVYNFLKRHKLNIRVIVEKGEKIFREYHILSAPVFVVINNGKIIYYETEYDEHENIIKFIRDNL